MADTDVREYAAQAASTDTFGRVLCSARNHPFVVDGPVQNGAPARPSIPPNCSSRAWRLAGSNWCRYWPSHKRSRSTASRRIFAAPWTVVDDFIDRVMADPRLNANPLVDEAHHRVPPAGFKYLVTEMVCWATGGPQKYTGKSMLESHSHLKITGTEWEAFMDDFQQTLDKFAVPAVEQAELKAIVNSTRADIVVDSAPAQSAA